jgi:comEA protein
LKISKAEKAALIVTGIAIAAMILFFNVGGPGTSEGFEITTQRQPGIDEVLRGRDATPASDSSGEEVPENKLININTATEDELGTLPGIGPVIAARIIEYREENGGFNSVIDILAVRGIGERVFENILGHITVSD